MIHRISSAGARTRWWAVVLLLALPACEEPRDGIVDSSDTPPRLVESFLSPRSVNTDTMAVGAVQNPEDELEIRIVLRATVVHPLGAAGVHVVRAFVTDPDGNERVAGTLHPESVGGDSTAFAGETILTVRRSEIGTFSVNITAFSRSGLASTTRRIPLVISRLNRPPELSNLQAPDTLVLGGMTQLVPLEVRATDPDGQTDIRRVQFNSFLPDGSASRGNPFPMYDDGGGAIIGEPDVRSGDRIEGDSVYTLTIALSPTVTPGTYRFEFQAFDRLNAVSGILKHNLVVRP